ncbi:endomucin isoform X4 [Aquarana catesbeiana]|uniref:endomucin isoform X3 n=1 Tax=Aquarana catesbeiana TaxID=8400 RepID=UPI003CCA55E8
MLERTMKPFGATAVFLAVINLLTVSSKINDINTISQAPGLQNSSIALTSTPLISNSPTEPVKDQSSPKTGTSPSVTAVNAASTSTSRSPIFSTVSTPKELTNEVSTSTVLNKDVNASTVAFVKASSAPPKKEEATTSSIHVKQTQKPPTNHKVQDSKDHNSSNSSGDTEKMSATSNKDSKDHNSSNSSGDTEKMSATSNKGIKIGAGCVAAVISVIVLVIIYKICQKKPPAQENAEEKACAETKENVKLISVKTESPTDMKRTNQMESIEC